MCDAARIQKTIIFYPMILLCLSFLFVQDLWVSRNKNIPRLTCHTIMIFHHFLPKNEQKENNTHNIPQYSSPDQPKQLLTSMQLQSTADDEHKKVCYLLDNRTILFFTSRALVNRQRNQPILSFLTLREGRFALNNTCRKEIIFQYIFYDPVNQ